METQELIKKVRKIEIKTRGLSNQIFSGEYHSAFKGRGMAFSEVREYTPGDDIRSIDWNVTARFNNPYVKVFEEERELTVVLLVDISGSGEFGTQYQFKRELITEICAVLSFSAIKNNDKVGVIFFSDRIEKFIPPKKGKSHILRIIRELIELKPEGRGTDVAMALRYFTNVIKKRSISFLISDFMSPDYKDALKIAARKHDLVALRIYDEREQQLPNVGLMQITDSETKRSIIVDTTNASLRNYYARFFEKRVAQHNDTLIKCGVDGVDLRTNQNYVKPLMALFKKRERR
ncbi:MAG: DUF58 domain-containing protein [Bacteroidetes bacterium]|nr:DUF58 domain-containing protein [Bacteroidota bacterium]